MEIWLKAILAYKEPVLTSRLYVNEGKGINDGSSIAKEITQETKVMLFNLERFVKRKEIRFDPVDCPVCLEMHAVELSGENSGYRLNLNEVTSNALLRSGNLFMFETDDPQIYFPLSEKQVQGANQVRIVFAIRSLKEQALKEIIKHVSITNAAKQRGNTLNRWFSPRDK